MGKEEYEKWRDDWFDNVYKSLKNTEVYGIDYGIHNLLLKIVLLLVDIERPLDVPSLIEKLNQKEDSLEQT